MRMSYGRGKHYSKKEKTALSVINEQTIMEIKLIALSHYATQERFQAREPCVLDEFI